MNEAEVWEAEACEAAVLYYSYVLSCPSSALEEPKYPHTHPAAKYYIKESKTASGLPQASSREPWRTGLFSISQAHRDPQSYVGTASTGEETQGTQRCCRQETRLPQTSAYSQPLSQERERWCGCTECFVLLLSFFFFFNFFLTLAGNCGEHSSPRSFTARLHLPCGDTTPASSLGPTSDLWFQADTSSSGASWPRPLDSPDLTAVVCDTFLSSKETGFSHWMWERQHFLAGRLGLRCSFPKHCPLSPCTHSHWVAGGDHTSESEGKQQRQEDVYKNQ